MSSLADIHVQQHYIEAPKTLKVSNRIPDKETALFGFPRKAICTGLDIL